MQADATPAAASPTTEKKDDKPVTSITGGKEEARKDPFTLDILSIVKNAQLQHGLRHSDYQRYRQYCARRLRRLRKSLGFLHGKGNYNKKRLVAATVTDARYLLLPLFNAERAWSYGMELKEDTENPRAKFGLLCRFKKAVRSAGELVNLANEVADDKTKLEAEAYSCWQQGNLFFIQESWGEAKDNFMRARTIYDNLSKVGHSEAQEVFKQKVKELDPSIRFCNYNLGSSGEKLTDLVDASQEAASALLQAQLDKVLAETRKKQAETMREISWNGKVVAVKSDKVREHILRAQEHLYEVEKADTIKAKEERYDQVLYSYNDAINAAREELRGLQGSEKKSIKLEGQEETIKALIAYITYNKLSKTIERDLMMAQNLTDKIEGRVAFKGFAPTARSVIPLFDAIIQNTSEMAALRADDDAFAKQCAANLLHYSSQRCYYLALSYLQSNKWAEATALFNRAQQHVVSALDHQKHLNVPDAAAVDSLKALELRIRGKLCTARASKFLEEQQSAATSEKEKEGAPSASETQPKYSLLRSLDVYDTEGRALKEEHIIDFPPDFEPVACKPILFDLALTSLEFPDLSKRKKAKGFFSFWK